MGLSPRAGGQGRVTRASADPAVLVFSGSPTRPLLRPPRAGFPRLPRVLASPRVSRLRLLSPGPRPPSIPSGLLESFTRASPSIPSGLPLSLGFSPFLSLPFLLLPFGHGGCWAGRRVGLPGGWGGREQTGGGGGGAHGPSLGRARGGFVGNTARNIATLRQGGGNWP